MRFLRTEPAAGIPEPVPPRRDGRAGSEWTGPSGEGSGLDVRGLLWSLIVPPKGYRTLPTVSGWVLVLLAFSLGLAAYNTASNILFIALSLLLSSLILSGMLAWGNFRRNRWRLSTASRFRAGESSTSWIGLENRKTFLPTYALSFEARLRRAGNQTVVPLATRLNPAEQIELPLVLTPARRGHDVLEVFRVRSFYPFGFLQKILPGGIRRDIWIWPARIPYVRHAPLAASVLSESGASIKPGSGTDLLSLRPYRPGDPPRAIHWKATARSRRIMVRQLAADASAGYRMLLDTSVHIWNDADQFERLCSLAATLAEDLFREGRLVAACVGPTGWRQIRRLSDLEALLDDIATAQPGAHPAPAAEAPNTLTFEPAPGKRVTAHVDGELAAAA